MDVDEAAEETTGDDRDDVHARAMSNFTDAVEPQIPVRTLALAARRFAGITGAQWDGDFGDQYANTIRLETNKIGRGVNNIKNALRQNRVVPDFRPAGGDSDQDTADTLDGLFRADAYHFKSQQAWDNACEEAALGGFGAYRLTNEYADPLDKDNDEQRINPGLLIPDADQRVFFGPSALYDKSDAPYAFVLTAHSPDAFKKEWGEDRMVSWDDGVPRLWYDWYRPDVVVVAEYYEIEDKTESLLIFTQKDSEEEQRLWEKDTDEEQRSNLKALGWKVRKRRVKRRRCLKYVLSGSEVLDDAVLIAGGNIPIVPVYYERYYIDGVEWFRGVVQQRMDAQRGFNGAISKLAEVDAMSPYERYIFDPEQMPPHLAEQWARQHVDRHAYALAKVLRNDDGTIAVPGPIGKVEPAKVPDTTAALLQFWNGELVEPDDDGSQDVKANTSEEAMQLAAQRVDAKYGPFLDNVRQSTQRGGELYQSGAAEVYVESGRVVDTMTEDGDDGTATLHEDITDKQGLMKTRNNFAVGKYKVIASVTEATSTRRDRTVKQMMTMAEVAIQAQDVQGAQAAIITATANMDGEGLADFQKWNRKRGLELGLFEPNDEEKQEAAQQAEQQGQQPNPQQMALQAQLQESQSKVGLNMAKTEESKASAVLKTAQAEAVGGPEQAPEAPSGLHPAANDAVENISKLAGAKLKVAQADHLTQDMHHQRIRTGAQLTQEAHDRQMAERAQDHTERTAA